MSRIHAVHVQHDGMNVWHYDVDISFVLGNCPGSRVGLSDFQSCHLFSFRGDYFPAIIIGGFYNRYLSATNVLYFKICLLCKTSGLNRLGIYFVPPTPSYEP